MHALGFSGSLFPTFIDPITLVARTNVIISTNERGTTQKKLVLPKTLATARNFYGCPTLNGVELEDQGGSGTAGSHFEARTSLLDVMCGIQVSGNGVTPLTLSVFEDSGWYKVNYSKSKPAPWGNGAGCSFATEPCINKATGVPNSKFWCTGTASTCDATRRFKSRCNLANYGSAIAPASYQYFPEPTKGGSNQYTDFCPYNNPITMNFGTFSQGPDCRVQSNKMSPNNWGETFGTGSFCMLSTLLSNSITGSYYPSVGNGCYSVSGCVVATKAFSVFVEVKGVTTAVACTSGATVTVTGYKGTLTCPPYADVC
jgi:hypothetical protein